MKKVLTKSGGILPPSEKAYFGGPFSFLERIKMNGVGSPKLRYDSGISEFDEEDKGVFGEACFVSMEVMKNGLIFRLNRNNRHRCVGIRLTDIDNIKLTAFRIEALLGGKRHDQTKIVHRGALSLRTKDQQAFDFQVTVPEFSLLLEFFQKSPFQGLFEYEVSEAPPERKEIADWKNLLG